MASLCRRVIFQIPRRTLYVSACNFKKGKQFTDALDHATGLEKRELLAYLAGDTDPFNLGVMERRKDSTKECPTLVPSCFGSRMIGCICVEDQHHINWMWLHKGKERRCECGHWFKLIDKAPI